MTEEAQTNPREMLKVMDPEDMERELMARIRKVTAPVPAFSA